MKRAVFALLPLLALLPLACSSSKGPSAYGESEEKIRLVITVTYLERMMLPPGSTVRAALYDESHELKPAVSSNAVAARKGRGVPVELELTYPIDQLDDSHEYVIRAEITDPQGDVLFETDEPVQVVTNQTEPQSFELVLKRSGGS
jgi:putative lipoprotein